MEREDDLPLCKCCPKLKSFVRWMTHEDRPYELHDDFLATLTRANYLKFRHMHSQSFSASSPSHHEPYKLKTSFSGESKHQTPSEFKTALNNYKKGPQRKAFFSQQEEISDDDEYANAEEQFSTDPEPEEHSPYSVYQSSFHPKMPQKSFLPPNTWETLSESTKQMTIEHNKKVKLNNPTPYPSGSKTKPNPTLGKPTPAPQQVHQHSQDESTEEPPPDTSTQILVNKCLAESGIDPTDIQNVMPVSYAKRSISPHESSRQIQPHQGYVFTRVNQSKHHSCDELDPTDTPSAVPTALHAPSDDTNRSLLPSGGLMADVPCLDHSLDGCKGYPDDVQTTKHARRMHAWSRCARISLGAHVSPFGASSAHF